MGNTAISDLIDRALDALKPLDPTVEVEIDPAGGGLRVNSVLDSSTLMHRLEAAGLPVARPEDNEPDPPGECCGGCCGS